MRHEPSPNVLSPLSRLIAGEIDSAYAAGKIGAKLHGFGGYVAYSKTSENSSSLNPLEGAILSPWGGNEDRQHGAPSVIMPRLASTSHRRGPRRSAQSARDLIDCQPDVVRRGSGLTNIADRRHEDRTSELLADTSASASCNCSFDLLVISKFLIFKLVGFLSQCASCPSS
mgnify:CR=1 FL=1